MPHSKDLRLRLGSNLSLERCRAMRSTLRLATSSSPTRSSSKSTGSSKRMAATAEECKAGVAPGMVGPVGTPTTVRRAGYLVAMLRSDPWDSTKAVRSSMRRSMERKAAADGGERRIPNRMCTCLILSCAALFLFLTLCAPSVRRMDRAGPFC